MHVDHQITKLAAAIAEPARARMLCALMDGRAYTATELATIAETAASTASAHLSRLTEVGLLEKVSQGRHRYFRLASVQVAEVLESMMQLAGAQSASIVSSTPVTLRYARSCYDHLAGTLAVALFQQLLDLGWLSQAVKEGCDSSANYTLTTVGQTGFSALGIPWQINPRSRRRFACGCLDWSERTAHLGGQLGAALLAFMLEKNWLSRRLDSRELQLTDLGRRQLQRQFGLQLPVG